MSGDTLKAQERELWELLLRAAELESNAWTNFMARTTTGEDAIRSFDRWEKIAIESIRIFREWVELIGPNGSVREELVSGIPDQRYAILRERSPVLAAAFYRRFWDLIESQKLPENTP